jgi:group I intron endonuclease
MIVYKTTNLLNNKSYIGKDSNNNPNYLGSGKALVNAIKKYGKDNFKKEILEYCLEEVHLAEREEYWIKFFNAVNDNNFYNICYNSHPPKATGRIVSKETREKISNAQCGVNGFWYGKSQSNESNLKRSLALLGKKKPVRTKKHSENLSKSNKGQIPWNKGKKNIYSDETRKKMSDAKKGKTPWNKKIITD